MVARSDGEHYGRLFVYRFPKQKVVFGPRQVVARINQDQVISPQITLWNQQGSQVIQGTLLVIPVEESLIYIRPLYLRSAGGRIPELKRVIVAYQNQIVMDTTLEAGLDRLFGAGAAAGLRVADRRARAGASRCGARTACAGRRPHADGGCPSARAGFRSERRRNCGRSAARGTRRTTSGRSTRSVRAIGPSMAKRSSASAMCCSGWRRRRR